MSIQMFVSLDSILTLYSRKRRFDLEVEPVKRKDPHRHALRTVDVQQRPTAEG